MPDVPPSRAEQRCGHADREAVAERLRVAAGDGRLDLDELEERLTKAYAARTYGDLEALARDLPDERAGLPALTGEELRLQAPVSDRRQSGHWNVPPRIVAEAGLGTVKVDFTEATCPHRVVHVQVRAWVGNVVLVVPPGWSVRTDEVTHGMGSVKHRVSAPADAHAPLLRVTGSVLLGDLVVRPPRRSRFLPR